MSLMEERRGQMFPVLSGAQIATARRFAAAPEPRRFAPGETVFALGEAHAPLWLVLEGAIEVARRDIHGNDLPLAVERPGQFSGEVSQLAGRPSLAAGRAGPDGVSAVPFDAAHLRALVIGSAEIGETVMRALILRRVGLIETGGGTILLGRAGGRDLVRLEGFLTRNGYPFTVLDTEASEGRELAERLGLSEGELPVVICPGGEVMRAPTPARVAACLGMTPELDEGALWDVAVVGAGPAGLATAVYAASEGLQVLVLDQGAMGGQAGASARIENYLGFPTGISGQALAGRAFNQAEKFGAEIALPLEVTRLDCAGAGGGTTRLDLATGQAVRARAVVVASGARYRRPDVASLADFEGSGVSYWASAIEARLCAGEEVALVGGGNSAGQAVVFLAGRVKRLHLVVRRPGLEATMSRYLVERIGGLGNVELHPETEVARVEGDALNGLTAAVFRRRGSGAEQRKDLRHLFLFIGADPNTGWLNGCVSLDDKGFILTGQAAGAARPLETSRPGVFAIGDARAGSTKRVAAAVGEGAAVVAQIHQALAAA